MLGLYLIATRKPQPALAQMRSSFRPFLLSGLAFGAGYSLFLTALDRGKVTIVSPLNGTYVLWTVILSAIFLRQTEAISKRLLVAALLVLGGAAIVATAP